jgi:4-alpha-glucanotransferase
VRSVDPLSVDTWISPELFRLGKQTGAPPDAFSTTGQNWGFPTYDWAAMKRENFRWWRRRLECMAQYFGA